MKRVVIDVAYRHELPENINIKFVNNDSSVRGDDSDEEVEVKANPSQLCKELRLVNLPVEYTNSAVVEISEPILIPYPEYNHTPNFTISPAKEGA